MSQRRTDRCKRSRNCDGTRRARRLVVTRKIFSPASGAFVRYLDIVSNPTPEALPASMLLQSFLAAGTNTSILVSPSSTGNTYTATGFNNGCCMPLLGFAFAGPGAAVSPGDFNFINGQSPVSYDVTFTVPPGESVIVMHFGMQRDTGDLAGIQQQAQALVNASDPDEFTGMSDADKARVINFNLANATTIPNTATISLTAVQQDSTPLAGAQISLNTGSFARIAGFTDATGHLIIPNVPAGPFTLSAYRNSFVGEANGTIQPADLGGIVNVTFTAGITGTVQGTVFAADGVTPVRHASGGIRCSQRTAIGGSGHGCQRFLRLSWSGKRRSGLYGACSVDSGTQLDGRKERRFCRQRRYSYTQLYSAVICAQGNGCIL